MIRFLDFTISAILLFLLLPIFIFVILWNLATGEHKVFFIQDRIGKNGEKFGIIKFATMLKNSPNMAGGGFVEIGDPRLLPLGRFLRKSKINELPQLLNVIFGEMSLVGFRPLVRHSFDKAVSIEGIAPYSVLPGITSPASIILRNEEEILANIDAAERQDFYEARILPLKVKLDAWWEKNGTLYNYCIVLLLTGMALFMPYNYLPLQWLVGLPNTHAIKKKAL